MESPRLSPFFSVSSVNVIINGALALLPQLFNFSPKHAKFINTLGLHLLTLHRLTSEYVNLEAPSSSLFRIAIFLS